MINHWSVISVDLQEKLAIETNWSGLFLHVCCFCTVHADLHPFLVCIYFIFLTSSASRHFCWYYCQCCPITGCCLFLSSFGFIYLLSPGVYGDILCFLFVTLHLNLLLSPQCSASPSVLPSLYGHLQCPAGFRRWTRSNGVLCSSSCPGSAACCLCSLRCLSEPPGAPWVCLQAAWPPSTPPAYHHPADVPGILGHGQSSFASLMVSASPFLSCMI